jgi:Tol biopolymer transport system component
LASANGLHAAFIAIRAGKQSVVTDGQADKVYDAVLENRLQFSPNGQLLAYAARRGSTEFLVVNHQESRPFDKVFADSITISPDGGHVACVVSSHGKQAVLLDGASSAWYDRIEVTDHGTQWLFFSQDGLRLAFVAGRNGRDRVVINGVEGKPYDWIGTIMDWQSDNSCGSVDFSQDSRHVAYAARKKDKWLVVMDGVEGPPYGSIVAVSLAANGRLGYVAGTGTRFPPRDSTDIWDWWGPSTLGSLCTVIDRHEAARTAPTEWSYDSNSTIPEFSPDGKHVGFTIIHNHKQALMVDGRIGKEFDEVVGPWFSPDSRHIAYIATINSKDTYSEIVIANGASTVVKYPRSVDYVLVMDSKESWHYKEIRGVAFSPDSKRIAIMAAIALHTPGRSAEHYGERLRWSVVVDGKAGRQYVVLAEYNGISFSPDSRHLSYAAFGRTVDLNREIAVLDEKEFDGGLSVTFGAGGRRTAVACRVRPARGLYIVVDGRKRLTVVNAREAAGVTKRYGAYLDIDEALFTRDGKHLAYVYSVGATHTRTGLRRYIGMDGHVVGEYDRLLPMQAEPDTILALTGASGVTALAVRNGELLRVEIRPRSRSAI